MDKIIKSNEINSQLIELGYTLSNNGDVLEDGYELKWPNSTLNINDLENINSFLYTRHRIKIAIDYSKNS